MDNTLLAAEISEIADRGSLSRDFRTGKGYSNDRYDLLHRLNLHAANL